MVSATTTIRSSSKCFRLYYGIIMMSSQHYATIHVRPRNSGRKWVSETKNNAISSTMSTLKFSSQLISVLIAISQHLIHLYQELSTAYNDRPAEYKNGAENASSPRRNGSYLVLQMWLTFVAVLSVLRWLRRY